MRVLVSTHGGTAIGAGHVVRALALVEEAQAAGHEVVLAGAFAGDFVRRQVARSGAQVVEVPDDADPGVVLADLVRRTGADVLHVDRYDLPDVLPDVAAAAGSQLLTSNVEDGGYGRRRADLSIDPTLGAEHDDHPGADGVLRRGVRFAPLRRQVLAHRDVPATAYDGGPVLVVMGGTDPGGLTGRAVAALAATGLALRVTAVLPPGVPEPRAGDGPLDLVTTPPTDDVAALMRRHAVVVSAAGTSVNELMCLGLPTALVPAAANQRFGYERVLARGAAVGLGDLDDAGAVAALRRLLTDASLRASLARTGPAVVDGLGAWRVVRTWEQLVAGRAAPVAARRPRGGVRARSAAQDDAALLLRWRNDAGTRAASRRSDPVDPHAHADWLRSSLGREDRLLLVAEDGAGPVGTVRWDRAAAGDGVGADVGAEWEVSITVAPERRGEGLAADLLAAGEAWLRRTVPDAATLLAVVHRDNAASQRLFTASGWTPDLPADEDGFVRFLRQP